MAAATIQITIRRRVIADISEECRCGYCGFPLDVGDHCYDALYQGDLVAIGCTRECAKRDGANWVGNVDAELAAMWAGVDAGSVPA